MEVLFTYSNLIGSKWIREITGEPVSHCAIRCGPLVLQSSYNGVQLTSYKDFNNHNEIVYTVPVISTNHQFIQIYRKYRGRSYDYGALFFLAIRYFCAKIGIKLPYKNLWQDSGCYLCTEFVTSAVLGKADSLITPYQLYLKLKDNK